MGILEFRPGRITALLLAAAMSASPAFAQAPPETPTAAGLVGTYDGHRMEMAAGLELKADGRFEYGLSYGALDEQAEGVWTVENGQVLLTTTPPVVPPRFVLLGQSEAPAGQLQITLDLPDGMSRQYFDAEFHMADGTVTGRQLNEDQTPFEIDPGQQPASVSLTLPILNVSSENVPLAKGQGHRIAFRFEPHDAGKAAFDHTPLAIDHGDLVLTKFGETIRFRRTGR